MKTSLWLVQLLNHDGSMGSFLCKEDPREAWRAFHETYGAHLGKRGYYIDVFEVEVFDSPPPLLNKFTQLVDEIAKETGWKDWPVK